MLYGVPVLSEDFPACEGSFSERRLLRRSRVRAGVVQNYFSLCRRSSCGDEHRGGWKRKVEGYTFDRAEHIYRSARERSGTGWWRVSLRSLLLLLLRLGVAALLVFVSVARTHASPPGGRSHTQTLKSHDNIWCKVGDTYFLLYFCHMLLFKREKIVFYG